MIVDDPKKIEVPRGCGTEKLTRVDFLRQIVNLSKREAKKPTVKEKTEKGRKAKR